MKDYLPSVITERPKDALYGFQEALVRERGSRWISEWKPSYILEPYIDMTRAIQGNNVLSDQKKIFPNSRMFILEQWLNQIKRV
jgi:hypothetical protein